MRIVHISDAHYNYENSSAFIHNIVDPLVKDLLIFHNENPIDVICFTGDLLDKGGFKNPKKSYEMFEKVFIQRLLNELKLPTERFLMIPGNHDIERGRVHKIIEKQLQETLIDPESIRVNMTEPEFLNLDRYGTYKEFQDNYYKFHKNYNPNKYGYSIKLEINGNLVGIAGLNSAWRSYDDNDRKRLILGSKQLGYILNDFQGEAFDIKIALMHHPYDHLIECDKDDIEGTMTREFDLLLTGHVHKSNSHFYQDNLGHGTIRSIASSNWEINVTSDSISHCNGYTIIDFNGNLGKAILHNRRYSFNKLSYIPNIDISQNEDGTSVFELPTNEGRKRWRRQSEIIDKIKSNYLPILDEKLLNYNTDTKAPKHLESLFVLPKIVVNQQKGLVEREQGVKKEEVLDFEQIVSTKEHLFLIGDKESGKSTLLYRILQYVTKSAIENKRIPIYIDLKKVDQSTYFTNEIASFLGENKDDIEEIFANNDILLLLDNVTFSKHQEKFLNKLMEEIQRFPNLIVVATSENQADGEIPIEYLTQPLFTISKIARIHHFQSNQIRTLMRKWFNLSETEHLNDKFENIVQTFHSLNIPTTPMAVSMFLWILEKQEEYKPKNNAAMLENFIEKLLNKHYKIEVRSDEFDFYNQNSLLTHIAKNMFEKGQINYRLDNLDLKNIIKKHFEEVGWRPKNIGRKAYYDWIPDYFIASGLLIEEQEKEETFIKFRLNSFFQFFLMQNIDIDDNFKNLVFHEDHYLEFLSEIDYYTALYRDKTDALKRIVTLMNENFSKIIQVDSLNQLKTDRLDEIFTIQETPFVDQFKSDEEIDEFINITKRTEEKDDDLNDLLLEDSNSLTQVHIENKEPQKEYHKMKILERSWVLAARVLKNSEESKESDYKKEAYSDVLEKSLAFMGLYHMYLRKFLNDINNGDEHKLKELENSSLPKEFFEAMLTFLPAVHQMALFQNLGTSKLEDIFKEHLDSIIEDDDISLIHKFTALFMYTDIHPVHEKDYLYKMIPSKVKNIVKDFTFSKLHYYESKLDTGENSFYPELLKRFIHMDQSNRYHPQRQAKKEETKHEINKKQLLEKVKNKRSGKKKSKSGKSKRKQPSF